MVIFLLQRLAFVCCNYSLLGDVTASDIFSALYAGKSLDTSMAGYFIALPLLIGVIKIWWNKHILDIVEKCYYVLVAIVISLVTVLDLGLYPYWGFRLDMTPVFYFMSSPSAAMASATVFEMIITPVLFVLLSLGLGYILIKAAKMMSYPSLGNNLKFKFSQTATAIVICGLLFVCIRGGVTVSTMNLSRAYFSQNQRLNHIAINPQFSLMYSATHQSNFKTQYRYLDDEKASEIFDGMRDVHFEPNDSLLKTDIPDIYIIIAESFSAHLMPSLGGEPIAMRTDSIAREGILFTNFYANSFRTDRAIPAILSGFPSQPNTSVMKYVDKAEKLPSLPKTLKAGGYELSYYYGGDINFTNMLAYLVSQGFEKIIRDTDFTISERQSKWGAHDDVVFNRLYDDVVSERSGNKQLRVIQTSSSHEPFKVPFNKILDIKHKDQSDRANAFAYADSCIGDFIDKLKNSGKWDKSLVIITPDHYGAYPKNEDNILSRHHVPLIFTGGALKNNGKQIATVGSQIDIVATVLAALGIKSDEFKYSKNLLSSSSPHFAFFTEPEYMGIVADESYLIYNLDAARVEMSSGNDANLLENKAKAYLQTIYDDLENL